MRIAQVAPLGESVPPRKYGGTERIVSYLTETLVQMGHDVTLYASGDSRSAARVRSVSLRSFRGLTGQANFDAIFGQVMAEIHAARHGYDIIHFHTGWYEFPVFAKCDNVCLTTLHGPLEPPAVRERIGAYRDFPLVSISDAQRRPLPRQNWLGTIYHGVPDPGLDANRSEGYLAFLGRISPEKRPDLAIEIARRTGMPLKIAAKVDPVNEDYFASVIGRSSPSRASSSWASSTKRRSNRFSPARGRCSSRSTGPSPSASSWWRRSPAARRLSPSAAARCRKSSRTASPASLSTMSQAPSLRSNGSARSTADACRSASGSASPSPAWWTTILGFMSGLSRRPIPSARPPSRGRPQMRPSNRAPICASMDPHFESPWPSRRMGRHSLPALLRNVDRTLRLPDQKLSPHGRWPVPEMRNRNSRPLAHPLRRPNRLASISPAQSLAVVYNPVAFNFGLDKRLSFRTALHFAPQEICFCVHPPLKIGDRQNACHPRRAHLARRRTYAIRVRAVLIVARESRVRLASLLSQRGIV